MKFTQNNETGSGPFNPLAEDEKNWVLDCLCGCKGVIPYEKIKSHKDLDAAPKSEFYSLLNNEIIDDKSYESVKKFWRLMRLNKLSELNDIYNFQETIILCEFFGNRAIEMMQQFPYNLQKCTSTTSLN